MKFKHLIELEELYNIRLNIDISYNMRLNSFDKDFIDASVAISDYNWGDLYLVNTSPEILEVLDNEVDNYKLIRTILG